MIADILKLCNRSKPEYNISEKVIKALKISFCVKNSRFFFFYELGATITGESYTETVLLLFQAAAPYG